jgi:hypothetical protein
MGTRKPLEPEQTPDALTILRTYWDASPDEMRAGRSWYADARAVAARIGPDVPTGAGVLAALSPQCSWSENVRLAEQAFRTDKATGHTGDACSKANRIMYGHADPLGALGGSKVRAFYRAIVGDPDAVVIDRHAFDVAVGRVTDGHARTVLSRVGVYDLFADAYREAAAIVGETPAALQAITWVVWRRQKGIVD